MIKSYKDLIKLNSFEDRYEYLRIGGRVGKETFGFNRYLNQTFYKSAEWKACRQRIIFRDNACDLAFPGHDIFDKVIVHHLNAITYDDIEQGRDCIFDPDNLVCTSHMTSQAIHYGDASLLTVLPKERRKGDTTLWPVY